MIRYPDSPMFGSVKQKDRLTLAKSVWSSKNGALFYVSEMLDKLAHIFLSLLFTQHANEKLTIF